MSARFMKGSWWVDFRFERERYRLKSPVSTKRGAEEYERQARQQLLDGTFRKEVENDNTPEELTFTKFAIEFVTSYAKANNKPSEVESKEMILKRHLEPAFGELKLSEVTSRKIEAYKAAKLEVPLKAKTINNHLTVLHKMLDLATEWKLLAELPTIIWLKVPEAEFDFLDFAEAGRLKVTGAGEWKVMIIVAMKTGLRLGELLALRWDDVDLVAGKLTVRRSVARGKIGTPKNGKTRDVDLSPETIAVLKAHRHLRGELVFCDLDGKLLTKGACKWPLWTACKKAGLRRIGWHVLRHTFASHLVMRGQPLKVVQELLGHATIEMTMRYSHLSPAMKREAVALLDLPAPTDGHPVGTSVAVAGS